MGKRSSAGRASRHTKKYWRKGTDVDDVEEGLVEIAYDKQDGGEAVAVRSNDDLFVVDREAREVEPDSLEGLTNKKRAILEKIMKRSDEPLPSSSIRSSKITVPKAKKNVLVRKEPKKKEAAKMDLWDTDLEHKVEDLNDPDGAKHYLQTFKLTRAVVPKTVKAKPSLLRAVALPDAGASYNPDAEEYTEFVSRLVEDEKKIMRREERDRKAIELPIGMKYCTAEEQRREMMQGLGVLDEEKKEEDDDDNTKEENADISMTDATKDKVPAKLENEKAKPKTSKQRRKEKQRKDEEKQREREKKEKETQNSLFKTKKLAREARELAAIQAAERKKRYEKKAIEKATKRKRIGMGKFDPMEEEFLLAEEMPGSIRQIKPQGCIVTERFQSLQKRNMVPVPNTRRQHQLKSRLKRKTKETRSAKEIVIGTKIHA